MSAPLRRRPQALRHAGTVSTEWLWFPAPDRSRLLALWSPGTEVRELGPGWVVRLPHPRTFDTRRAPATPLLSTAGRSTSAPLSDADLEAAPAGAVVVLHQGRVLAARPSDLPRVDPSTWIDLDRLVGLAVEPLGPPPPPPTLAAAPLATQVRARMGVAPAPGGLGELVASLGGSAPALPALPDPMVRARGAAQRALAQGLGALGGLMGRFVAERPEPGPDGTLPPPSAGRRMLDALDDWAQRLGLGAALEAVVGHHNSRYLQDMLAQFDRGNWLDAVQRAIPLGHSGEGGLGERGLTWLRSFDDIRFRGAPAGRRSLTGNPSLYDHLQRMYRRAYEALRDQGKHKEAAYVLSDLLGEVGEAVTYLEEHGEYGLAAELAEARSMDPGLVVLLWMRAGDVERATAIATVRRAWAAAVLGLERRQRMEEAAKIRTAWARQEHAAGRVLAAVEIAWSLPGMREEACGWLDAAVAAGGVGGAQALARSFAARPEHATEDLRAASALADDEAPDAALARRALAAALGTGPTERRALRAAARGLLRDAAPRDGSLAGKRTVDAAIRAADASGDGALVADLPRLGAAEELVFRGSVTLTSRPDEAGTTSVHDVVRVPRGRWLVALGDLGAVLLGPDGRRQADYASPAHALVATPDGSRVLVVGRRADRQHLFRWDAATRALTPWCDAALAGWSATWDGTVWFVAERDRVVALDGGAVGLRALWSVGQLGLPDVPVAALEATAGELRIAARCGPAEVERFRYELPSLVLRARQTWPLPERGAVLAVTERGLLTAGPGAVEHASSSRPEISTHPVPGVVAATSVAGWDALVTRDRILLVQPNGLAFELRAELVLGGAGRCRARFCPSPDEPDLPPWLVVHDDRGRIRALDLATGRWAADLRI